VASVSVRSRLAVTIPCFGDCLSVVLLGGLGYYFQMLLQIDRSTSMISHSLPILLIDLWEWLLVGVVITHKCTIHVKQMTQYAATVMGISAVL